MSRNSVISRVIQTALRLQQPLLRTVKTPAPLNVGIALFSRTVVLPGSTTLLGIGDDVTLGLKVINHREDARKGHYLVYCHGGGFCFGSPESHRGFAARLMQAGRFEAVYIPRYRLGPDHPRPSGLNDIHAFWDRLKRLHPEGRFSVAGESAGGNICVSLSLRLRDAEEALPEAIYLHSPWLDVSLSGKSYSDHSLKDPFFGSATGRRDWMLHLFSMSYAALNKHELDLPDISPLFGELHGLPNIFIQASSNEVFIDDCLSFRQRCEEYEIDCELEVWDSLWHAFGMFAPFLPEANSAIKKAGSWLAATSQKSTVAY